MMREAIAFIDRHRGLIPLPTFVAIEDSERADVVALLEQFQGVYRADDIMFVLAEIAAEHGYDAACKAADVIRQGGPPEWVRGFRLGEDEQPTIP